MTQRLELANRKYGRLTCVEASHQEGRSWVWSCVCECGTEKLVKAANLQNGGVRSCGCLARETLKRNGELSTLHGHCGRKGPSPTWISYASARARCVNPNRPKYRLYGALGVEFRFRNFAEFLAELGPRPEGKSVDRFPNPYGHYEPGNVRWATRVEQAANKRKRPVS